MYYQIIQQYEIERSMRSIDSLSGKTPERMTFPYVLFEV